MRKIEFEMIPEEMWYCNLRHVLTKKQWDKVRMDAYGRFDNKCSVCGRKSKRLEAHEYWEYDMENAVQKLTDVVALCPTCHKTIHIGFAGILGLIDKCFANYCKINKCTMEECKLDYLYTFEIWHERNKINWVLDLKWLEDNYEIKVELGGIDKNKQKLNN